MRNFEETCWKMGNQASLAQQAVAANHVPGEPLESFSKEKQRDDHLKNLGFKRSKSIRKSIAKRLKRKKRNPSSEDIKDGVSKTSKTSEASSLDTRIEVVERPTDIPDKPLVGIPQPLPAHVQVFCNSNKKLTFCPNFRFICRVDNWEFQICKYKRNDFSFHDLKSFLWN